eukprot:CAMPEP_0197489930 /NCGR_PEP_ID=MMETSP1311-20131121/4613_1 /TAXON_ID=464262 /ORGANISM="Genus nov. species nov., Strain RCC856" /LENGTH=41 /DNA_ID= /DNA_START= /DNA_END= /DNA_ORIENTATION=
MPLPAPAPAPAPPPSVAVFATAVPSVPAVSPSVSASSIWVL